MSKCVFPGTFDPFQDGHLNIASRASKIFDEVVIGVAVSSEKGPKHSIEDRVQIAQDKCNGLGNVTVKSFDSLLVDFVKAEGASCVVRGLRNSKDFDYESNMAAANNKLSKDIDTLFFLADPKLKDLSSTQVRELESFGIDTHNLVE